MTSPSSDFNPYQSPIVAEVVNEAGPAPPPELKILKRFRREMQGLGGVWIFLGGVGLFVLLSWFVADRWWIRGNDRLLLALSLVVCGLWVILGVFTCIKQMWSVVVGLVLSYVSLLGDALLLIRLLDSGGADAVCGGISVGFVILILLAIILQAHRCIGWAGQLTAAGIPLTARPGDFWFGPPPGSY